MTQLAKLAVLGLFEQTGEVAPNLVLNDLVYIAHSLVAKFNQIYGHEFLSDEARDYIILNLNEEPIPLEIWIEAIRGDILAWKSSQRTEFNIQDRLQILILLLTSHIPSFNAEWKSILDMSESLRSDATKIKEGIRTYIDLLDLILKDIQKLRELNPAIELNVKLEWLNFTQEQISELKARFNFICPTAET